MPRKNKAPKIRMTSDPQAWPIPLHIAYAIDYRDPRGIDDEENGLLTFVFIGATGNLLYDVFELLCHGGHLMKGFKLDYERMATFNWRNGHHFWRWTVTPSGYNDSLLSLDSLRFLIESRIRDRGHLITYYNDYNKFLNI